MSRSRTRTVIKTVTRQGSADRRVTTTYVVAGEHRSLGRRHPFVAAGIFLLFGLAALQALTMALFAALLVVIALAAHPRGRQLLPPAGRWAWEQGRRTIPRREVLALRRRRGELQHVLDLERELFGEVRSDAALHELYDIDTKLRALSRT